MNNETLDMGPVPFTFPVCFNHQCAQREQCLRFTAGQQLPADRLKGLAVYPQAWQEGPCKCFRSNEVVLMAWGFSKLYRHLDRKTTAQARMAVQRYFSAGQGPYYRYHHGERLLTPAQQQDILDIVNGYGPTDDQPFDHYIPTQDFT